MMRHAVLEGRDLLRMSDLEAGEVEAVLALAYRMKEARLKGGEQPLLRGKILAMLFYKASTRTRVSFEAGISQLGGTSVYLDSGDVQLSRGETIEDTGRVLGRYVDGVIIRTFAQADVEALAASADIPVVNALTDEEHPCQALADLMTMRERFGRLDGLRVAFVGDGNNVCASLMVAGAMMGQQVRVASPEGYRPTQAMVSAAERAAERARKRAAVSGSVEVMDDPLQAVEGADVVYTDTWTSMGQDDERRQRLAVFAPYQVTAELMDRAKSSAVFMHCLPAHRGEEVTAEVIDGPQSIVFEQAENRLHVQKALLVELLGVGRRSL